MNVVTAVELVSKLRYRPGWRFTAEDHTNRFEGSVKLRIEYTAHESGRPNAREGYPELITTHAEFALVVGDLADAVQLYRRIVCFIMKIEEHEARELLRVDGTFWSPFHPHTIDGIKRWHETRNLPDYYATDLQFGLA